MGRKFTQNAALLESEKTVLASLEFQKELTETIGVENLGGYTPFFCTAGTVLYTNPAQTATIIVMKDPADKENLILNASLVVSSDGMRVETPPENVGEVFAQLVEVNKEIMLLIGLGVVGAGR